MSIKTSKRREGTDRERERERERERDRENGRGGTMLLKDQETDSIKVNGFLLWARL